ncbi:hypothetical protein GIB67_025178 [Kingdonia uniflora]|uniref:BED-type domain-containing protein n=1 Tax=Kingdonia uniflora TaxID=39325 RepID=A0A7J7N8F5_9MAGN|nr:hypothetical protein GIB67_025178 [Kingdonia uniflora]
MERYCGFAQAYCISYKNLDLAIRDFLTSIKPSVKDKETREDIIDELEAAVQSVGSLRGAKVEPFGSFVYNIYLGNTDLDISIYLPSLDLNPFTERTYQQNLLRDIGGSFTERRIPILTFRRNIPCDITINNRTRRLKSKFLLWISSIDGRFREMVLLVKKWANIHGINNSKDGYLNSYALCLLVIFHLQTCTPAILPPLKDIYSGDININTSRRSAEERRIQRTCAANIKKFISNRVVNRSSLVELYVLFFEKSTLYWLLRLSLLRYCDLLGFVMSVEGSQGSTGRYRPTNSNDPGWDYGQPVDGNRDHVKCDFCGHVSKGGIKRLKQHLVKALYKGTMYKDVRKCDKVPQDVVDVLRSFMEGKQKITEEKQSKKNEMIRNVNVYGNDDDEVKEVMIQIPKKRKWPMDAFVAPIDVDFRPRASNSNENKKALENIHGTVFLKSIDGSAHIHDAELIYKMLKDVIEEVGEKNVIQICTDNASNYVLAGEWIMAESKIYWIPCAAHCINLMLGDVSKMHLVDETVKDAKKISLFIYNHKHVLHLMRKQTKGREIVKPAVTRFATTFLCLHSMYEKRQELRDMFHTANWRNSKWPKHPIGKEIVKKVKSNTFWNNMHTCLKIMAPLVDVIRMVDTEEKPSMAYIYSAIEDCKLKVKTNLGDQNDDDRELWKKMERILDRRWSGMLQKPLHAAAHYLNPQYYYATLTSSDEMESNTKLKKGLLDCIAKFALDEEDKSQILRNLIVYRTKAGRLGKRGAQACVKTIVPVEWWITFGSEVPALQRFAKRVLGLTSAASPCERIWSTFDNIHTKKMNCLEHDRMRDLAYIQYNRRLKKRYEERISGNEIDPIVLKSFDECAEWLVPDDARDDIVLGTDMTYGVLEDAEDGFNDPPLTRTSRTNTASHCSQGVASSSRSTTRHLQDSSDDDDYDVDANYGMGDGDDDGIDSGSDEDI